MLSELRTEMPKATRQRIHVLPASGNWSGILLLLLTTSQNSKSIFECSQDAILKDEENMKETNTKLEKLKSGSCTKIHSCDMIFSEESRRAIYEIGNLELIELRQTSATIQYLLS